MRFSRFPRFPVIFSYLNRECQKLYKLIIREDAIFYPKINHPISTQFHNVSNQKFLLFRFCSKVSQRKILTKKHLNKCVCCNTKVDLENLRKFIVCQGCDNLACRNQKCSDFIAGLQVWECGTCNKNRSVFNFNFWEGFNDSAIFRIIQQKAGEWLLNQLNSRLKNSTGAKAPTSDEFPFFGKTSEDIFRLKL